MKLKQMKQNINAYHAPNYVLKSTNDIEQCCKYNMMNDVGLINEPIKELIIQIPYICWPSTLQIITTQLSNISTI